MPSVDPPAAAARAFDVVSPHGTRRDEYHWLRDDTRSDSAVIAHLNAENDYTRAVLAPSRELEQALFDEMRARIQEDDSSVPVFDRGYWYYSRFEKGRQHAIVARRKGTLTSAEHVLLDGNQLSAPHTFYRIGSHAVSPDGRMLAWTADTVGRNKFKLHVKDLVSGELLADTFDNIASMAAWANDSRTLFFVGKDPATLREDRVFRLSLGQRPALVFHEEDASYYVSVGTTKSRDYVLIGLRSTVSSETRLIDASAPEKEPRVFLPRRRDHLYSLDHLDGRFVVRTNREAKNFRLMEVRDGEERDESAWRDLIAHRADTLTEGFVLYHRFVALSVRNGGLRKVEVATFACVDDGRSKIADRYFIDADEPSYTMSVRDTPGADAANVRYVYGSLVSPASVFEADVSSRERIRLKEQTVPTYDRTLYASEYIHARATDGSLVPISLVYRKSTPLDGTAPVLVYGYGAYGFSMDAHMDSNRVSLLDRGFVYAIAHVRGGQELGRAWYEGGKLAHKMSSFTDFIAVTEHLVARGYGAGSLVFAEGGSAGGLLVGAVMNMRPDLYRGVVANVPFVDVVTTMLDETIPLTTNELDEWGDPKTADDYATMLAYSPYDNVRAQGYPSLYVHTGLWDSQVQYFEPAKWVARLRAQKTDRNLALLDIDMTSGHGGASGRFDRLRQIAREVGFVLMVRAQPDGRAGFDGG
jgi:oligopeptidase B